FMQSDDAKVRRKGDLRLREIVDSTADLLRRAETLRPDFKDVRDHTALLFAMKELCEADRESPRPDLRARELITSLGRLRPRVFERNQEIDDLIARIDHLSGGR